MTGLLIALGKLQLGLTLIAGFLFGFKAQKVEIQAQELQQLELEIERKFLEKPKVIPGPAR